MVERSMDNLKNDTYYKEIILKDIDKILQYTKDITYDDFLEDEQLVDAVLFWLIQIVENIKKLSDAFKNNRKDIAWNEIVGFRNRIVHDYGKTDYSIVYEVISNDMVDLKKALYRDIK